MLLQVFAPQIVERSRHLPDRLDTVDRLILSSVQDALSPYFLS